MRVNGEWLECDDGVIRPSVKGVVRLPDGRWVEVTFLLDAGADRTVFSAAFFSHLAGVGGTVGSITIETASGFVRDDGRPVRVRGEFHVFTESESSDLSGLGRDVTNNFGIIYDYPNQKPSPSLHHRIITRSEPLPELLQHEEPITSMATERMAGQ